ncbi:MAG: DNA-binding protein [Micrococcus sp.]|nr:DNA-binding protein [Micrococcus sp.]
MSTLTAPIATQEQLLTLQDLDTRIDRAKADLARLRSNDAYAQAQARVKQLRTQIAHAEDTLAGLQATATAARDKASATRAHRDRTHNRLHDGHGSHKELEAMMHEEQTLDGLLTEHEAEAEQTAAQVTGAESGRQELTTQLAEAEQAVTQRADHLRAEGARITAEGRSLAAERATLAGSLPAELVQRYDKIRARNGGVGAARLTATGTSASSTPLSPVELDRLQSLPAETVAECPETGALLVRS